jgi:prevent-host-death family protein
MKRASITAAKNGLSALIDRVKAGSSVLIVDRGRPVARLEPVTATRAGDDRLERLIREGVVRPARLGMNKAVLASDPPAAAKGASVIEALLDERRTGR